jgi:hypothetical protein
MNCPECGAMVASSSRFCPGCYRDVGYPNVRLASQPEEKAALSARVRSAEAALAGQSCSDALDRFGAAVAASKAVIARSIGILHSLVKSDNQLYVNFHKQVQSGARLPESNQWDKGRVAAESTILPHIYENISFGSLTLDGRGILSYGELFVTLKEQMIAHRATVFEENPFIFCNRHKVIAGTDPPKGYRAIWAERDQLAKAKLYAKLSRDTEAADFPTILSDSSAGEGDGDFIEVHIHGPIHRRAIERVIGYRPKRGPDLALWKSVGRELARLGATLEAI